MTGRIAIVLPRKEAFATDRFGAIALTVEAYLRHSADRDRTEVLGLAGGTPRDPARFRAIAPRDAWWRRRNLGFAEGCIAYLAADPPRHIDVHNRVEVFHRLAARFPQAATSLWFHNDPQTMRGAARPAERRAILATASRVICVSDWLRRRFLDGIGEGGERVIVMPNPIEIAAAPPPAKVRTILYVGRLMPDKGALALAEALAEALPQLPDWRAALVGEAAPRDAGYRRRIMAALAPLGARVAVEGFLPHEAILARFAAAEIAAVPSHWQEPFGRTALEAMAGGAAVIASRRGGLPELLGEAGLLVEPPDAPRLAAAILRLARDEALRAELQRRARARAALFDARLWAARLDALRAECERGDLPTGRPQTSPSGQP